MLMAIEQFEFQYSNDLVSLLKVTFHLANLGNFNHLNLINRELWIHIDNICISIRNSQLEEFLPEMLSIKHAGIKFWKVWTPSNHSLMANKLSILFFC